MSIVSEPGDPFNHKGPTPPMRCPTQFLRETLLVGRQCREMMLDADHFRVLRKAPFIWIGYSVLYPPYRMVRLRSVHSHLVASVSGRGRTLIDGKSVAWKPGQILLAPVGQHHAFEIADQGPWTIAWVFFEDSESAPVLHGPKPVLLDADATDFIALLKMLTKEGVGAAQPAMMESLVTALDTTARRLGGPSPVDQRLWRLWAKVESDLAHAWTGAELARTACMSEEHLRRLCHRSHQRSPIEHLTQLRMRRAGTMLRSSSVKLDEIAQQVGYASVYSFSAAFSRCHGVSPGRYRKKESSG